MTPFYPRFSFVTATLNCRDLMQETIASLQSQTYRNFEHVVVDGVSTDGTLDLLLANKDSFSVLVSERDKNLYDAMNKGMHLVKGDYVFFLNAGDVFASTTALEEFAKLIFDPGICYFAKVRIKSRFGDWLVPDGSNDQLNNGLFLPHHQSIFYPRWHTDKSNYDLDFKIHSDVDFTTRAVRALRMQHVPVVLIESTIGGLGTTLFKSVRKTRELSRELKHIAMKLNGHLSPASSLKISLMSFVKFTICNVLGDDCLHQYYRLASWFYGRKYR
jgi:glycosyltransferase